MSPVRIGFDVGQNSVGSAAVEFDNDGMPVSVKRLLVTLHDSGKDSVESGQTASVSRKASGGAARRVRRLFRNRRRRVALLEAELANRGYPVPPREAPTTYGPWDARQQLIADFIDDTKQRQTVLSSAIRHMSNHRGWANAWVSLDSYLWSEEPTSEFKAAVAQVVDADQWGEIGQKSIRYQADLASFALDASARLRPRQPATTAGHLLGTQRRADVVREWREICRVQQVPDEEFVALARIAFSQKKPHVPVERVGNDWLEGFRDKKRAAVASMEHQEFKIRQTVANLAIRETARSKERQRISADQQNLIVDHLMSVTDAKERPTWRDIAELFLDIPANLLVHYQPEEQLTGLAPVNSSVLELHSLHAKHPLIAWWINASPDNRCEFMLFFGDSAGSGFSDTVAADLESLILDLDEKQQEQLTKLKFSSGRSAHSLEALRLMNAEMERIGDTYVEARNRLFGKDGGNVIPQDLEDLDTQADHPTLQRILPVVRRFLLAIERESGAPDRVVIEHVRDAFLGFNAKQEASLRMIRLRRDRENAKRDIANAGLGVTAENADQGMIRKFQALARQNCQCLYCGATPEWSGFEMDHIVSRASGGNSTRANLVAVCRECNAAKDKEPFARFAASGRRANVSLDGALQRVKEYQQGSLDRTQLKRLRAETGRRLKQTELDEPIDERSLASTAYAAVDMRRRIRSHYDEQVPVDVYSGSIVSMARHASGIDKMIWLREGLDVKSRFDRRHHAIDAAVTLMLDPSVASTLAERDDLRREEMDTGKPTVWRDYEGSGPTQIDRFRHWKGAMQRLSELISKLVVSDEIVVMQPVRFSAHHAKLHLDGRSAHVRKSLGDDWAPEDLARIVDDRVYEAIAANVKPGESLPEAADRTIVLPNGLRLDADGEIFLFPDGAARHPLPNNSSSPLGATMHHIRLFRWTDAKGKLTAGVVRVWASDLYDLEDGIKGDLLTSPLRPSSRAVRRSKGSLQTAIWNDHAEHVGTFLIGDELELEPAEWFGDNEPGRFFAEYPERHWRLLGGMSDSQFTLGALVLSREGIAEPGSTVNDRRKVEVSQTVAKVLGDRLLISASALWSTPSTRVIRRTGFGTIRPEGTRGLPATWSPYDAVHGS